MRLSQNPSETGRWGHHVTFITLSTDEASVIKRSNRTSEQRRPTFCSQNWKIKNEHCSFSELFSQFSRYFQRRSETGVKINLPWNKMHFSSGLYTERYGQILSITSPSHFTVPVKSSIKPEKPLQSDFFFYSCLDYTLFLGLNRVPSLTTVHAVNSYPELGE